MDATSHAFHCGCRIIARRSNSPAHYADDTPSFYFLDRQRKGACVRRNIFRGGWLPACLKFRKFGYLTATLKCVIRPMSAAFRRLQSVCDERVYVTQDRNK